MKLPIAANRSQEYIIIIIIIIITNYDNSLFYSKDNFGFQFWCLLFIVEVQ
jgi:hypothetical protein